jgi:hypothetical protein
MNDREFLQHILRIIKDDINADWVSNDPADEFEHLYTMIFDRLNRD